MPNNIFQRSGIFILVPGNDFGKFGLIPFSRLVQKKNDKSGKTEWALISKKDPNKVLKWFGGTKPSAETVQKEEKRIQWFKHKGSIDKKAGEFYVDNSTIFDSVHYDKELIADAVQAAGGTDVHFEPWNGWSNQPEVVVFSYPAGDVSAIEDFVAQKCTFLKSNNRNLS